MVARRGWMLDTFGRQIPYGLLWTCKCSVKEKEVITRIPRIWGRATRKVNCYLQKMERPEWSKLGNAWAVWFCLYFATSIAIEMLNRKLAHGRERYGLEIKMWNSRACRNSRDDVSQGRSVISNFKQFRLVQEDEDWKIDWRTDIFDKIRFRGLLVRKVCPKWIQEKEIRREELETVYIDNSYKECCWQEQKWLDG